MKEKVLFSLILACFLASSVRAASSTEVNALLTFYADLRGENWNHNEGWSSGTGDVCTWFGVQCDSSNHVTSLILDFNNLNGVIPDSISDLDHLQQLSLNTNFISGALTPYIGSFQSLHSLDLSHNYIVGSIPSSLGTLVSNRILNNLNLSYNRFSGVVPAYFNGASGNFKSPPNLSHNRFQCPVPEWAAYTSANCLDMKVERLAPLGSRFGEGVLITTSAIGRDEDVYCSYDFDNAPTLNALFVSNDVWMCPTPSLIVNAASACSSSYQTNITLTVSNDHVDGSLVVSLLPTNCQSQLSDDGRLNAAKVKISQLCLNGNCADDWGTASGSSDSAGVSFHRCESRSSPTALPHSVPAGQWWYHKYTASECDGGLPPADKKCVAALTNIIDCATNAYYGDWRIVMPGETHNGVAGPAIYWWCYEGCSTRNFYRGVDYVCA